MAFCQVWFYDNNTFGHLGLALQTPAGHKTYITLAGGDMNPGSSDGSRGVGVGHLQLLPEELRTYARVGWTRRQDDAQRLDGDGRLVEELDNEEWRQKHRRLVNNPGWQPYPQQKPVLSSHGQPTRRVIIRQRDSVGSRTSVGPGNARRMSLVLAAGQIYAEPSEIVDIPVLGNDQFGVDTDKIFYWWKSFAGEAALQQYERQNFQNAKAPEVPVRLKYVGASRYRNCCGTVYLALRVGGATYFESRTHTRFVATPRGVLEWAKQVRASIENINRAGTLTSANNANARAKFCAKIGRNTQRNPNDLPTLEEWKKLSYVGPFARRKEQIAVMDRELQAYHSSNWDGDDQYRKARALHNIMRAAEDHARTKPLSDRSHAVSYLIAKAWEVLERRLRECRADQNNDVRKRELTHYGTLNFSNDEFHHLFMRDKWIIQDVTEDYDYIDRFPSFIESEEGDEKGVDTNRKGKFSS
jgi:hypothetical protein